LAKSEYLTKIGMKDEAIESIRWNKLNVTDPRGRSIKQFPIQSQLLVYKLFVNNIRLILGI
jgi:hypothetical protein